MPRTKVILSVQSQPPSNSSMQLSLSVTTVRTTKEEDKRDFYNDQAKSPCSTTATPPISSAPTSGFDTISTATTNAMTTATVTPDIGSNSNEKDASSVPCSFASSSPITL